MTVSVRTGSTLIELLVVLAILAVLASVVSPVAAGDPLRSAGTIDARRQLRSTAIETQRVQREAFDAGGEVELVRATPSGLVVVDSAGHTRVGKQRNAP